MRDSPYISNNNNYHMVVTAPGVCLHFSYSTLVGVGLKGTNFISKEYLCYSNTTQKHITALPNRVIVSQQLLEEILEICYPKPLPQTRDWLLLRSKRELIGTHY